MSSFLFKFLTAMRCGPNRDLYISTNSPLTNPSDPNPYSNRCAGSLSPLPGGFSLLEVIAVVVIVGILAAIAAPSWLGLANRQRVNSARDEVLQAIRTTQSSAKQKRRPQELGFTPDSTDDIPTITLAGIQTELGSGNLKANMVNMSVTDGNGAALADLEFRADGTVETEDPEIVLPVQILFTAANSTAKRCLLVETLLGSVRSGSGSDCS